MMVTEKRRMKGSGLRHASARGILLFVSAFLPATACSQSAENSADGKQEVLVVEQTYDILRAGKEGPEAKAIRQNLYITRDWVRIDEFPPGRADKAEQSFFIDFARQLMVTLDHDLAGQGAKRSREVEAFAARRAKAEEYKAGVKKRFAGMAPGVEKDKMFQLFRGLLDDDRTFKLVADEKAESVAGLECARVRVLDAKDEAYTPLSAALHPTERLPYDSAEVLYLLRILGANLAGFLKENKETFQRLPMAMELNLAAGGTLKTKVVSVRKIKRGELPDDLNRDCDRYPDKRQGPPIAPPDE